MRACYPELQCAGRFRVPSTDPQGCTDKGRQSIARICEDTWVRHTGLGCGELYLVAICMISSPASPWIAWWRVTASTSIWTAGLLGCDASGANKRADTVVSSTAPLPSDSPARRSWPRPRGPRQACATAPSLRAHRRMSCTKWASRVTATRCSSIDETRKHGNPVWGVA